LDAARSQAASAPAWCRPLRALITRQVIVTVSPRG
jgi:hypothetical protein